MAEYIEREALIDKLAKGAIRPVDIYTEGIMTGLGYAMKVARELPTADVVEVVHSHYAHDPITGIAYCAECQMDAVEDGTNYCPNCGARMRGSNDEE